MLGFFLWDLSGGIILLLLLLIGFWARLGLKRIVVCALVVGLVVLAVVYNLIFWIPLIFCCLIVWGYLMYFLKWFYKKIKKHIKGVLI